MMGMSPGAEEGMAVDDGMGAMVDENGQMIMMGQEEYKQHQEEMYHQQQMQ